MKVLIAFLLLVGTAVAQPQPLTISVTIPGEGRQEALDCIANYAAQYLPAGETPTKGEFALKILKDTCEKINTQAAREQAAADVTAVESTVGRNWCKCGDGQKCMSERCEDGNTVSGDGCDANCTLTGCGNSIVTMGEDCDSGNSDVTGPCVQCVTAFCGDGFHCTDVGCTSGPGAGVEVCDDGNTVDGDGCEADCSITPPPTTTTLVSTTTTTTL